MKLKFLPFIAVALVALALAFAGCGSDDESDSASSSAGGNGTDRAFVKEMVPHHQSAIDMAEIAQKRGESDFVKTLAQDIVDTQQTEIDALKREDEALDLAGVNVGSLDMDHDMMGMDGDMTSLEKADPFDTAFVEMMIPHHEGAVMMAEVELDKGADPELKKIAQDIVDAQKREIDEMKKFLADSGEKSTTTDSMEGMGH